MRRTILIAVLIAVGLSACGKRARSLDPPDPGQETFPKHYPPPDDPGKRL